MFIYDLHCDTLSRCLDENEDLYENNGQLDLKRGLEYEGWIQVFACFVDSIYTGNEAFTRFKNQAELFNKQLNLHNDIFTRYNKQNGIDPKKCNAVLSVEGGHCLDGKLENIDVLKAYDVKMMTLVWNGDNELASGVLGDNDRGLTDFGKAVIREMENKNIIVDISHLNDKGIYDVIKYAQKPIIATHSNSRTIADNKRNLKDAQFKFLVECNGLCGINFYPPFISATADYCEDDLRIMIEKMLSLGGENILALGSDFDGATMPHFISGIESLYKLYELMVKWFGIKITEKIFYKNAYRFFNENIN